MHELLTDQSVCYFVVLFAAHTLNTDYCFIYSIVCVLFTDLGFLLPLYMTYDRYIMPSLLIRSAIISAAIASTHGTTLGTMHASCLPSI